MFLTPGEKLVKFRKKYKITQADLAGEDLSRTSLGMIETGKRSLTSNLAQFLEENFIKIFKERGITDEINMDELLKSKEVQAHEYLELIITEDINKISDSMWTVDEALIIVENKEKSHFSKIIYKKYLGENDYANSKKYLLNYFHFYDKEKNSIAEILDLMKINEKLNEYEKNVDTYDFFYDEIFVSENIEYFSKIRVFYGRALYKSGQMKKAIENLMFFMKKAKTDDDFYNCRKTLADAYAYNGKFGDAVDEYVSLAKGKTDEIKIYLYSHVLKLASDNKNIDVMKKFYNRTRDLFAENNVEDNSEKYFINIALGQTASNLNKKDESHDYFLKAFKIGKNLSDKVNSQMFLLGALFEILDIKDFETVLELEDEYKKLLKIKEDMRPAIKLIDFYRKNMPIELERKIALYK